MIHADNGQKEIRIVDCTLRDGEQRAGISFGISDKVKLALLLDKAGVYQIEAGIPAMGGEEKESICTIMQNRRQAKISAWNRMNLKDIEHSVECSPDIIHISVPVSEIQISSKLHKDKEWVKKSMTECVNYAKMEGFEVTIGFEDASRAEETFLTELMGQLKVLGVRRIRFADTIGIMMPSKIKKVTQYLNSVNMDLEYHGHNDFGMAVANSLEAAKCGIAYIDCTLLGIGERVGNCSASKFLLALKNLPELFCKSIYDDILHVEEYLDELI